MSIKLLRENYGTKKELEIEGVWITPILDDENDIAFLVARMARSNRRWASRVTKVYRKTKERLIKVLCLTNRLKS